MSKTTIPATIALPPWRHSLDGASWQVHRERLDATWAPLVDEKGRAVHGHAEIHWTDPNTIPDEIRERMFRTRGVRPYELRIVATRNGEAFGASHKRTYYGTREAALAAAQTKLAAQGKRYADKYGAKAGENAEAERKLAEQQAALLARVKLEGRIDRGLDMASDAVPLSEDSRSLLISYIADALEAP